MQRRSRSSWFGRRPGVPERMSPPPAASWESEASRPQRRGKSMTAVPAAEGPRHIRSAEETRKNWLRRLPILVLGLSFFVAALYGGLWRLGWPLPHAETLGALHGPLMISGFFGALIGLERAVALGFRWAFLTPLSPASARCFSSPARRSRSAAGCLSPPPQSIRGVAGRAAKRASNLHRRARGRGFVLGRRQS